MPRRHDVAPAPADRHGIERPTRHEHDDALVGVEPQLRALAVDDVERRHFVGEHRAVGALERELVADRELGERPEVRVAMARDHADAGRAQARAAVHERGCERQSATRCAGEDRQRLAAAGERQARDGMRVGPRPRLGRGVALRRAVPGAIEQCCASSALAGSQNPAASNPTPSATSKPTAQRRQRRCRARGRCSSPSGRVNMTGMAPRQGLFMAISFAVGSGLRAAATPRRAAR